MGCAVRFVKAARYAMVVLVGNRDGGDWPGRKSSSWSARC